ncbi:hypothetical protein MRX96_037466 [Rhipicephalus microplus]
MANRKFPASLYRLCVVYVAENVHSLCPANEETFASAFPLGVSKDLVVQFLKQQNFTSLYHLIKHLLSRNGLRYIEHRFPVAILSRLPRLVRETPDYLKHLVELSLGRRCEPRQQENGRDALPTGRPAVGHAMSAQRPRPPSDDRLYHLMTRQHLLRERDVLGSSYHREVAIQPSSWATSLAEGDSFISSQATASSSGGLPTELCLLQPVQRTPNAAVIHSPAAHLQCQQLPSAKSSQSGSLQVKKSILHAGLLREFKNHALGVSSATLKIFSLEQAEPGLGVVGIGLNTLALCMFHLYAASVGEECPVLKNLEPKDMLTLIPIK